MAERRARTKETRDARLAPSAPDGALPGPVSPWPAWWAGLAVEPGRRERRGDP